MEWVHDKTFIKETSLAIEIFFLCFSSNRYHLNKHDLIMHMMPKDMLSLEM